MSKSKKKAQEEAPAAAEPAAEAATSPSATEESVAEGEDVTAADRDTGAAEAAAADGATDPDPLAQMTADRDACKEKWLRAVAELDNVRKRSSRDLVQGRKFAQADVLRSILEVVDNFERALQSVPEQSDTDAPDGFRAGVELIYQRLRGVLKDQGVEPMEALEAPFDPTVHEAVGQFEREGVDSGVVIEIVQQGYHFGDLVLRPARVIISA